MPPIYVFIRNLLHNEAYNPSVVAWLEEEEGSFRIIRKGLTGMTDTSGGEIM